MRTFLSSCKIVFSQPEYIILAVLVSFTLFLISIWLPIHELLTFVAFSDAYSLGAKLKVLFFSFGSFKTNFSFFGGLSLVIISILTGINVSMFVYYVRKKASIAASGSLGIVGALAGILGVGCASCGSVIITTFIGIAATSTIIARLPLHGVEFSFLGIVLIILSIWFVSKKIQDPFTCSVKSQK